MPAVRGPALPWAGGPDAWEMGSVWLSGNAVEVQAWLAGWQWQQVQASQAAKSAQTWGNWEQLQSCNALAGSAALLAMTSIHVLDLR